ncbi:MAG: hypothetical protein AAGC55_11440, partial [Myxococcota bacterium]
MRPYCVLVLVLALGAGCYSEDSECGPGQIRDDNRCIPNNIIDDSDGGVDPVLGCTDSDATNFDSAATEDDGSCVFEVLFAVDMSAEDVGGNAVYLRGSFNDFAATANPMNDDDGDDIWEAALDLAPGTYEYLYTIGDISNGGIDDAAPAACDFNPGDEFPNRGFELVDAPLTLPVHRFRACPGQTKPQDFETITFDDPAITYTLTGFGGAEDATVITDPDDAGNQVVQIIRSAAAETFAGTTVSILDNEAIPALPFAAGSTSMTVRVRSPAAGIQVRLKVEDSTDPTITVETETTTTVADAFETLTFDFANQVPGTAAID